MRDRSRVDLASLVSGLAITALGTLLLLDRMDTIDLQFGWLWPALTATVGAILVASGLTRGRN